MSTALEKKRAENLKQADEAYQKAVKLSSQHQRTLQLAHSSAHCTTSAQHSLLSVAFLPFPLLGFSTKKTLTRWKPDWEGASRYYRDAVKLYKLANDDEKTIQACRESAIAHDEQGQFLTVATDLQTAAQLMCKEGNKGDRKEAYECYRESGLNYRKNNSYEKGAEMYVKAAECIEDKDQQLALEALKEACAIFEDEQRGQFHDATFKKAINAAIKYGKYEEAIGFMRRQNQLIRDQGLMVTFAADVYKNHLQTIILYFHMQEPDAAKEALQEAEQAGDRFAQSDQYSAAVALVDSYEEGDSEKLSETLKMSAFKFLSANSIAVMARKLQMQDTRAGGGGKKKSTAKKAAAGSGGDGGGKTAAAVEEDEKDEDDFT